MDVLLASHWMSSLGSLWDEQFWTCFRVSTSMGCLIMDLFWRFSFRHPLDVHYIVEFVHNLDFPVPFFNVPRT